MHTRQPGSHGPSVSVLGLGCMSMWGLYGPADDAESVATIERGLTARLGLKVPVECQPAGTLPRYKSKAQRVLVRTS